MMNVQNPTEMLAASPQGQDAPPFRWLPGMLRFLRLRPNRWDEIVRMRQMGIPKVTAR